MDHGNFGELQATESSGVGHVGVQHGQGGGFAVQVQPAAEHMLAVRSGLPSAHTAGMLEHTTIGRKRFHGGKCGSDAGWLCTIKHSMKHACTCAYAAESVGLDILLGGVLIPVDEESCRLWVSRATQHSALLQQHATAFPDITRINKYSARQFTVK